MRIELPTLQNWSCHNCGGCCRQHLIEVTEAERERILRQNWTSADGIEADQPVLEWHAGPFWKKRYRLAHRADGSCVFLNEQGLCRIHAKFGEAAKPLPCRIYPYAFHPSGKGVAVSLRFSCPSVVKNAGTPVSAQQRELKEIVDAVVPAAAATLPPPAVSRGAKADWEALRMLQGAVDQMLAETKVPLPLRLVRLLRWAGLIEESRFDVLSGRRLSDFLQLLRQATEVEQPQLPPATLPDHVTLLDFRLIAAVYARRDTVAQLSDGWWGRVKLLRAILKFVRGQGSLPAMQEDLPAVPYAALEIPWGPMSAASDEKLTRLLRVKVQGWHFCGRAFYGLPFVDGLYSLILLIPVTLWLARWVAVGRGHSVPDEDDLIRAIAIADHNHGFSDLLGGTHARSATRRLASTGDLANLCVWTARPS